MHAKEVIEIGKRIERYEAAGDATNLKCLVRYSNDPAHEVKEVGRPITVTKCFGTEDEDSAMRTGGWSVDQIQRGEFLRLLGGPPLALLLAGLVLTWIAKGFRHRA